MTVKKRISRIVGLTADIVKTAEAALNVHEPAPAAITDEIRRLWSRDYGYALRKRSKPGGNPRNRPRPQNARHGLTSMTKRFASVR